MALSPSHLSNEELEDISVYLEKIDREVYAGIRIAYGPVSLYRLQDPAWQPLGTRLARRFSKDCVSSVDFVVRCVDAELNCLQAVLWKVCGALPSQFVAGFPSDGLGFVVSEISGGRASKRAINSQLDLRWSWKDIRGDVYLLTLS